MKNDLLANCEVTRSVGEKIRIVCPKAELENVMEYIDQMDCLILRTMPYSKDSFIFIVFKEHDQCNETK